jgi:aspartate racemase
MGCYLPDGRIVFQGRMDHQAKIRGFRIDPGEIESALHTYPGIKDAVVVAKKDIREDMHLCAYLIPQDGVTLEKEDIMDFLAKRIPDYMLPAFYHSLEAFPLTSSGKIDRGALPEPSYDANRDLTAYQAPNTHLEKQLVEIWEDTLGITHIGIDDNFFDLGGHSLSALRMVNQIREKTGSEIPLETIFQAPTIKGQARYITNTGLKEKWSPLVIIQPKGDRIPFFCISPSVIDVVTYRNLAKHIHSDQPFYALYVRKDMPPRALSEDEGDVIDGFINAIQKIQPHGPYLLGGYSAGGKLAIEMARRLSIIGEKVNLVVLFDSFAPGYPRLLPFISPRMFKALRVLRRVESYFWKFWILDWQGKRDLASTRRGSLVKRLKIWFSNRYRELKRPIPPDPFGRLAASEVNKSQLTQPYNGDITLIRASQGLLGVHPDHSLGWEKWCLGKLQVITTPGDHEAILFGPRLPVVAGILQSCLDEVKSDVL